jgi:DNA adenine methylase
MTNITPPAKVKRYLRPPVSYYGGKQSLLTRILPLIPPHQKYDEVFLGGGAVYWTKEPAPVEVINDMDGFVANFYKVVKTDFTALKSLIESIPISRKAHDGACIMRQHPEFFTDVQRAWSFFYMTNTSIFSILENAMNTPTTDPKPIKTYNNKVERFLETYSERLKNTFIESRDALYCLTRHDSPDTFHFIDPPYFNANMGHYGGYTRQDFEALLEVCGGLNGKFLLTCYPSDVLDTYAARFGWIVEQHDMSLSAGAKGKRKTECFVRNYAL